MKTTLAKRSPLRVLLAVGSLALGTMPLVASSASATPSPIPTASGAWGTVTMPADFHPYFIETTNWYGADAAGNIYYVPGAGQALSVPRTRRANTRTSHVMFRAGIERYTPSTGQSVFIDPSRDFTSAGALAVEASGNVDIVVYDTDISQWVVMRVSPTGQETVLNSTIPFLGPAGGIAVDASGNVFVSAFSPPNLNVVYEIPSGGGSATSVGVIVNDTVTGLGVTPSGTVYATSGPWNNEVLYSITPGGGVSNVAFDASWALGIAVDGAGNLFAAESQPNLVEEFSPSGVAQYLPPSPAVARFGGSSPTLLAYGGGTIYMWDYVYTPLISGVRSNVYLPNILYTWTTSTGARPFLTSVDSVAARVVNRYTQSITATWTGGGPTYRCTLMTGFHNPTGFTVLTTAHSCTFYGLALGSSFGISVVSISGGVSSAPQVGFAPAPKVTITCKLGTRTLHRSGLSPTCPPGWRQV